MKQRKKKSSVQDALSSQSSSIKLQHCALGQSLQQIRICLRKSKLANNLHHENMSL